MRLTRSVTVICSTTRRRRPRWISTSSTARLLLIKPGWVEKDVNTALGVKDATVADVTVLDGAEPGVTLPECSPCPQSADNPR